ncbi:MAG: methyltransferase domain-containing protein [Acidimicrobiales bacterium]|nr:methyltransferase domain-containing protein [Acidimicrobiales bacterium]RZV44991.1 MAG: methyltransferase domain-containing protein [Acidimicrobiales bacterium]
MSVLDPEVLTTVRELPMRSKARRAFIARTVERPIRRSLEIGALNVPTILPGECDARFLDWFSTDELRARHQNNPVVPPDSIVPIDHVVADRAFSEQIDDTFDLIIANHVIEHVPDLIYWFDQLARISEPDGRLLLSVPDRRYTFDYYRTEDDAVDVMRASADGLERPSRYDIAKHLYYFMPIDHREIWSGTPPPEFTPRMSFAEALDQAGSLSEKYTDVHCWVFTQESFVHMLEALGSAGLVAWRLEEVEPVQNGENEFRVLLRR